MERAETGAAEAPSTNGPPPSRRGERWSEADFRGVMEACRDGCELEEIAARIGRTPDGLRGQLRRLLPLEERHLASDLVIPRLRQLDADGGYDWLSALAERSIPEWERRAQAEAERGARGFGALTDDEVLGIAQALVHSSVAAPAAVTRPIAREISEHDLEGELARCAATATDAAFERLMRGTASWWTDSASQGWRAPAPWWAQRGEWAG